MTQDGPQAPSARLHTEPRGAGRLVLALLATGVLVAVAGAVLVGFRAAGYTLGVVLLAASAARLVLPVRVVGPLAVRSRLVDAATTGTAAAAMLVLSRVAPA